jgi:hypothetical protein
VVHQGQGLPLGLEAGDDLRRVQSRLDNLQRHAAADGAVLLGQVDGAHAPFAQFVEQLVGADCAADAFVFVATMRGGLRLGARGIEPQRWLVGLDFGVLPLFRHFGPPTRTLR